MQAIIKDITNEECGFLKKLFSGDRLMLVEDTNLSQVNEINILDFLTKTELKALNSIINEIQYQEQGDVKVSQLTEKYNISTSVFRTLFYKMKEHKIAEIDSRGVKGTHIHFYNFELLIKNIENYKKI